MSNSVHADRIAAGGLACLVLLVIGLAIASLWIMVTEYLATLIGMILIVVVPIIIVYVVGYIINDIPREIRGWLE
jgi:hypothetical protein